MPLKKKKPRTVILSAKDIEYMTGRSYVAAKRLLTRIRKRFGKESYGFVTVREFSLYTGIDEETIQDLLND